MNILGRCCVGLLRQTKEFTTTSNLSSFKSSLSLSNLYPNSSLKLTTPTKVPDDPNCEFSGYIPIEELEVTYSRSSGPGGQNVNMVNTKVDLRFHVASAKWISENIKARIKDEHKTKINKEGYLIIRSDKTRLQQLNLADALERLRTLVRAAAEPSPQPTPESEEVLRRRREKSARLRLMQKRFHSQTKQQRQAPTVDF
ncbi:large ribosomal subunit protein mL62 isoform X1 [Bacillus rossius redtenbacheri]|uniref:large ribosomal subunit protein mL62 isoform X1 n=1 Tax=Bacillus rossius redtenbacheri TaxID=93214 RepID=UPI002FDE2C16